MSLPAFPPVPGPARPTTLEADTQAYLLFLATWSPQVDALGASISAFAAGTPFAIAYTFSTTITVADPTAGKLRLNNATQNLATALLASLTDAIPQDRTTSLGHFADSTGTPLGWLKLVQRDNTNNWLLFSFSAMASPAGYKNFTVACIDSSAANPFADGASLVLMFQPNGNVGPTGATGPGAGAALPGAGNVTLTNGSAFVQYAAFNANGQYIKFPDATTMANTGHVFSLVNPTQYFGRALDTNGKFVGILPPMSGSPVLLADKSTAAGKWHLPESPLVAMTGQTFNATSLGSTTIKFLPIWLDADRTLVLLGGTALYAIVYNRNTGAWGAATLVRATIGDRAFSGIKSATDQVLVASCDGTTGMEAVTLTTAGTGITVNSGTKATATLAANILGNGIVGIPIQFAAGTLVFPIERTTTTGTFRVVTVTGTTPTIGAENTTANSAGAAHFYVSGSTLVSITNGGSGHTRSWTIAGAVATGGTAASGFLTGAGGTTDWKTVAWSGSWLSVGRVSGTSRAEAALMTLSGTTMTASQLVTPLAAQACAAGDIPNHEIVIVSATKAVLGFQDPTGVNSSPTFNVLTNTAGTLTGGTPIVGSSHSGQTQRASLFGIGLNGTNALFWGGSTVYSISAAGASPTVTSINYGSFPVQSTNAAFGLSSSQSFAGTRPNNVVYSGNIAALLPVNSISTAVYDGAPVACGTGAPDVTPFDYDTRHGVNPQNVALSMVPGDNGQAWAINYASTTYGWTLSCFEAIQP